MSVRSAQAIVKTFTTRNPATGAAVNADSTPAGTLVVNGVDNGASVTVATAGTTGVYKATVTLPTLAIGDIVEIRISATVSTIADNAVIWTDSKDLNLDTSGNVTLTAAEHQYIAQEAMGMPGVTMKYCTLAGSNTNTGGIRDPYADPNYMALHGGSNTMGFVGPGTFDLGTLNVPMPDGMSLVTCGPELTQIRSSFDELVGGGIVKPGSNSIIKGAYVYGYYNGISSGYTQPFGFIAKNGTNGQSIPTNFAYIDCVADGDLGADGILHQTKNNDLTPCKYRVVNFRSYARFDAFNQVANSGGNWPIEGDITGSTFSVNAGSAGWTFARAFVLSSGTVRMSDSYLISYSADPAQAQTIGMNVRPVSATAGATAYLTNVSMAANGTAGSVADIMCGSSPTAGTTGAVLYVSGSTYRTASGAAAVVLLLHDTNLSASQVFNNTGQTTLIPSSATVAGAVTLGGTQAAQLTAAATGGTSVTNVSDGQIIEIN